MQNELSEIKGLLSQINQKLTVLEKRELSGRGVSDSSLPKGISPEEAENIKKRFYKNRKIKSH